MSRTDSSTNRRPPRSVLPRLLAAAVVLAAVAAVLWYGVDRWQAGQRIQGEGRRMSAITKKGAIANQPLSEGEFAEALALTTSDSPEIRETALRSATADAVRHHADRRDAVVPVAARLTADPDAAVRRTAGGILEVLKERERVDPAGTAAPPDLSGGRSGGT